MFVYGGSYKNLKAMRLKCERLSKLCATGGDPVLLKGAPRSRRLSARSRPGSGKCRGGALSLLPSDSSCEQTPNPTPGVDGLARAGEEREGDLAGEEHEADLAQTRGRESHPQEEAPQAEGRGARHPSCPKGVGSHRANCETNVWASGVVREGRAPPPLRGTRTASHSCV